MAAIFLLLLYGMAVAFRGEAGFFMNEAGRAGALILSFALAHLIGFFAWESKPRIENILITILLLLLLADPQTSPLKMWILGLVTALIKTVVRLEHQPLFNPAAAGLLAMSFFGVLTTWWGVSFSPRLPLMGMSIAMLLTIPFGLYEVKLYKKVPTLIGVTAGLMVTYLLLTGRLPLYTVFEGTFAFFLLIMATEPKTTPLIDWQEWIYAVALGAALGFLFVNRIAGEPYLAALLLMNLFFGIFKWFQLKLVMR